MANLVNRERVLAVQNSFHPAGKCLLAPSRVLIGEGRLLKQCRKRVKPKAFFLFNDILVYGSIVVKGRWNNHQQILRLEEVEQEDVEDGEVMKNQWIIRTPRKSFFISAASREEKQAWMEHIERCRAERLSCLGYTPRVKSACLWVPDLASDRCMRCPRTFSVAQRRHHCRNCGFVVCNSCSKERAILRHISPKPVRVCRRCVEVLPSEDLRRTNQKASSLEVPEYEGSSDEFEELERATPARHDEDNISLYCYFHPEQFRPHVE